MSATFGRVLGAVGDLIDDVVVRFESGGSRVPESIGGEPSANLALPLNLGTDTAVRIERRRGGSAANVCVAAVRSGSGARFLGQVGDDAIGRLLEAELVGAGVEAVLRRRGRTATVVVLCHPDGERTMLTDRGGADGLDHPDMVWLDGLRYLHVPLYSCSSGPLAATTVTLAGWARAAGVPVSLDLSATVLCREFGPGGLGRVLDDLAPEVVLANEAEAQVAAELGLEPRLAATVFVVKRGRHPAVVMQPGRPPVVVKAMDLGPVPDTTGAGDAFAGGWLAAALAGADPVEATRAAHVSAAAHLRTQGAAGRDHSAEGSSPGR